MNNLHFVHKLYKILMFSNNLSILLFLIILSSEFVQGSKVHKLKEFTFKFFVLSVGWNEFHLPAASKGITHC